jgi:glycosyltransferase involved in cell wall biosynthesis
MMCSSVAINAADERPVRILYILTSLGIGGAEKQAIDLAEQMKARGHVVALMVLKHVAEEWPTKLPVFRLNLKKTPIGVLRGLRFAQGFLAIFRPDIVHSHTFPANIFGRLLRMMPRSEYRIPKLVNTIHNINEGGRHRMLAYRLTDSIADRITAVSAAAAERFINLKAVSAAKTSILTNGIDTNHFTPDRNRRKQIRAQMLASQGDKTFIWIAVGRIVPAKDYPNLLAAFAQVLAKEPTALLCVAGEGDSTPYEGASNLRWLGLRPDIDDLLDAADGFVLSSAWEGMPLALGEAMAMEKLCVATNVGGVSELIGTAGTIVPPHNSEALAEAMLTTMHFTQWQQKSQGQEARRRIQAQFSIQAKAAEWAQLYAELTQDPAA